MSDIRHSLRKMQREKRELEALRGLRQEIIDALEGRPVPDQRDWQPMSRRCATPPGGA